MLSNCEEHFPKVLQVTLEQLVCDYNLSKWNLQAHGNGTYYVNLCFMAEGGRDNSKTVGMGLRNKTPSQRRRDAQRLKLWERQKISNSDGHQDPNCEDDTISKDIGINTVHMGSQVSDLDLADISDIEDTKLPEQCDPLIAGKQTVPDIANSQPVKCDDENKTMCLMEAAKDYSDNSDLCVLSEVNAIKKVIYDEKYSCLVAVTKSGNYITYKHSAEPQDELTMGIYQEFQGTMYKLMNQKDLPYMFETFPDARHEPAHHDGLKYIHSVIKSKDIT